MFHPGGMELASGAEDSEQRAVRPSDLFMSRDRGWRKKIRKNKSNVNVFINTQCLEKSESFF